MILTKLQLQNFRNYEKIELSFDGNIKKIVLLARNAAGKTNILEGVYMLALTKSFRGKKYEDLVLWGKDFCSVKGTAHFKDENKNLEVFIDEMQGHKKVLKINDVKVKAKQFIGEFNVVLFHPEDLNMLYLSPSLRRQYLNILLCQTSKNYFTALSNYKKIIKQRNKLLFKISEGRGAKNELEIWDEKLVENGKIIVEERRKAVKFLNKYLGEIYRGISGGKEKLEIKYKTNTGADYYKNLAENLAKDIKKCSTSIGSHRDDLVFYLNDKNIEEYGSRGEFRTVLLALKLAEIKFIEDKMGKKPVLLLDDVFSELDPERQKHLFKTLQNCQTLITTTDIVHLEEIEDKMHVFELADGKLIRDYVK